MEKINIQVSSHFDNMRSMFEEFYNSKTLVDVVLVVEGKEYPAHRLVLSTGSNYFHRILTNLQDTECMPVIVITEDISSKDIEYVIEFLYRGQVIINEEQIASFRRAADKLGIKGFH